MIVKFTYPSDRVKGISFHPTRPWLLTALYSGVICLWDYRLQMVIDKYEGHSGPVRGIQFHPKLALFVSGGDDTTVRVWNYNTKKEQFLLKGHLDYVRCVGFHPDQPWVISCADDQTARIWNYQSRQMIAIMTGHSNYVMQCQFHPDPSKEYIITCSLDLTARLWSYSPLKQKYAANKKQSQLPVSGAEIVLISVLAGHKDQLNWCTFHPTQPYIATAADDKKIMLWKYTEAKCWHFDTLSGHTGNVNSVVFHPKFDVIISNSEDKTTKIWDFNTKQEIQSYQSKEQDRFWIVSAHLDNYYFACGSDTSFLVFTLFRDRVPFVLVNNNYLCIGEQKQIRVVQLQSKQSTIIKDLSTHTANVSNNLLKDNIINIQYNQYNSQSTQLLLKLQPETKGATSKFVLLSWEPKSPQNQDVKFFIAIQAIFVGKNKVLRIKEDKSIEIFNLETDNISSISERADNILHAPGGKCLLIQETNIQIYDPLSKKTVVTITNDLIKIKQAVWQGNFVAILGKKTLMIYTKMLTKVVSFSEQIPLKSAVWIGSEDAPSFLIYTTKSQIKYMLLNGETGVIKSTEHILYLARAEIVSDQQNTKFMITGMENRGNMVQETIDLCEPLFKQALFEKNVTQIQSQLSIQSQYGDSMISYLHKKKYSSLAMDLVQDKQARFQLAISSHNLEVAFRACSEIKERQCYQELGFESLRQGHQQIVELCHQQLNEKNKLSFFYAILGERERQIKIQQNAIRDADTNLRFQSGIYLGDPSDKVKQLWESGQKTLAYYSAITHGLSEEANQISILISKLDPLVQRNINQGVKYLKQQNPQALVPPISIIKITSESKIKSFNWPQNYITTDQLIQLQGTDEQSKLEDEIVKFNKQSDVLLGIGVPISIEQVITISAQQEAADELEAEGQWGLEEEIEIDDQPVQKVINQQYQQQNQPSKLDIVYFQTGLQEVMQQQVSSSMVASNQLLVGNYKGSISTLKKQIALKDPSPLIDLATSIIKGTTQIVGQIPFLSSSPLYINEIATKKPLQTVNTIQDIQNLVKQGYKQTTDGKFSDTLITFNEIIKRIPLIQAQSKEQLEELNQIIKISLSYVLAMRCELMKKKFVGDQIKNLELGCYMTLCNLQPQHYVLTMRSCMSLAVKYKNYITGTMIEYLQKGSQIAKRLIDLLTQAPEGSSWAKPDLVVSTTKVLKQCEQQGTNALKINFEESWLYDEKIQDRLSASTLTIIQNQIIKSPYVNASYEPSEDGKICLISNMCVIGQASSGLKLYE